MSERTPYDDDIRKLYARRVVLLRRRRLGTAKVWHLDELAVLEKKLDELEAAEAKWLREGRPGAPRHETPPEEPTNA